jgi:hypothetical protein
VEPLNAKFADFLDQYREEDVLTISLGLALVESGCFRLRALVFYQGGRRIALAGKENPVLTPVQTAIAGLLTALTWEHPRKQLSELQKSAPRTTVCPPEIADVM